MKTKLIVVITIFIFQFCKAQQSQTALLQVENYNKGELELKITSFGDNNPITIGKVLADGTIYFNWLAADLSNINGNDYMTRSIKNFYGGNFCQDPNVVVTNENTTLVEIKYIYLFKYGQAVGAIIPSTQIDVEHNNDQLGSTINWIYSDSDTNVKAHCTENKAWEDLYDFDQTITYELKLKKGFNLVSNTLTAIEEWDTEEEKGSLPRSRIIQSLDQIPGNLHWQLKYWANDEALEIEQQLVKLKPITKQQYESWLPKKLGKLKRTNYEIGKAIERIPNKNNVNLLFEKDAQTIDLTIIDCAGNKDAVGAYTMIMNMLSRDWKDKTKTGYNSATEMDGKRVMTEYNEKEAKTTLNYNANKRFIIKAEATNMNPEEIWEHLKTLNLKTLKP
ncbi:hypothetical protein [Bizionia arctica]|uniref:Uncharacterized protein n=1 Tax=Bizionia arctica TaxID=1495645 RepID=A0A917GGG6_9FLAO|nr:hypothetical protein [Bizionia arctica]GGG44415.1 hypothetical protein GCM10010976_15000 [Bizionia arctica]